MSGDRDAAFEAAEGNALERVVMCLAAVARVIVLVGAALALELAGAGVARAGDRLCLWLWYACADLCRG